MDGKQAQQQFLESGWFDRSEAPSPEEFELVPRFARVAFASRCAARVLAIVRATSTERCLGVARELVEYASLTAQHGPRWPLKDRERVWDLLYQKSHDVRGEAGATAAIGAAKSAFDCAHPSYDTPDDEHRGYELLESLRATSNAVEALRFLLPNVPVTVIRDDFDGLLAISRQYGWDDHASVPQETFGPKLPEFRQLFDSDVIPQAATAVVRRITIELVKHLKRNPTELDNILPRQFEELIAEILTSYGWEVQLTPKVKDGGYDILGFTSGEEGLRSSWIIECKKNRRDRTVGIDVVRALYGTAAKMTTGAGLLLATTSDGFSPEVHTFKASRYDLELRDYHGVLEWINEYKANPGGKLLVRDRKLIFPGEA